MDEMAEADEEVEYVQFSPSSSILTLTSSATVLISKSSSSPSSPPHRRRRATGELIRHQRTRTSSRLRLPRRTTTKHVPKNDPILLRLLVLDDPPSPRLAFMMPNRHHHHRGDLMKLKKLNPPQHSCLGSDLSSTPLKSTIETQLDEADQDESDDESWQKLEPISSIATLVSTTSSEVVWSTPSTLWEHLSTCLMGRQDHELFFLTYHQPVSFEYLYSVSLHFFLCLFLRRVNPQDLVRLLLPSSGWFLHIHHLHPPTHTHTQRLPLSFYDLSMPLVVLMLSLMDIYLPLFKLFSSSFPPTASSYPLASPSPQQIKKQPNPHSFDLTCSLTNVILWLSFSLFFILFYKFNPPDEYLWCFFLSCRIWFFFLSLLLSKLL